MFGWLERDDPVLPVVVVNMGYEGYVLKHRLLALQQFASFEVFGRFVRALGTTSFFVKANRDKIRVDYLALVTRAPFSQTIRFPNDIYVHLGNVNLERMMGAVLHAVDLPDRQIERGAQVDFSMSDAKRHFDVSVDALLQKFNSLDFTVLKEIGVYDRESFEETFELVWRD